MTPGDHRLPFDARRLPSGVYFYALTHDDGTTATMMPVRRRRVDLFPKSRRRAPTLLAP